MSDWRNIQFSVPIQEKTKNEKNEFLIKGVAINETVTRNGTMFVSEELEKGAPSLRNKPILKDHNNSVDSIVGHTTENVNFNSSNKRIDFEGVILDESVQEKINRGLIKSVSVGAFVRDVEKVEDEESGELIGLKAKGIDFVELSLVAVPADPNAGFAMALQEAYNKKITVDSDEKADEKVKEKLEAHFKKVEEEKIMAEEKSKLEQLQEERAQLEEELEAIRVEKLKEEKARLETKEEVKVEEPKKEQAPVEDETEGVVADDKDDEDLGEAYVLQSTDVTHGLGLSINYAAHPGLKNFKR